MSWACAASPSAVSGLRGMAASVPGCARARHPCPGRESPPAPTTHFCSLSPCSYLPWHLPCYLQQTAVSAAGHYSRGAEVGGGTVEPL
eukprot:859352-Pyramimonas_sp.AAC.1